MQCATERWAAWCSGADRVEATFDDSPSSGELRIPGTSIVGDVGSGDVEHPGQVSHGSVLHLQKKLIQIVDASVAQGLLANRTHIPQRREIPAPSLHYIRQIG